MAIFRLADMWLLDEIRAATLSRLHPYFSLPSPFALVEKLRFATRYNVPSWIMEVCMELATRPAPPSQAEAAQLGQGTAFGLMAARESIARRRMRIALGSESRWRCSGGEAARSRGCARQVLTAFRSALTVEVNQDECRLADEEKCATLDTNTSFPTVWCEALAAQRSANRSKNPGLCDNCARAFSDGKGPGALAWVDYDADVAIVRHEMKV